MLESGRGPRAGLKSEWSVIFLLILSCSLVCSSDEMYVSVCMYKCVFMWVYVLRCVPFDPLGQMGFWLFDL